MLSVCLSSFLIARVTPYFSLSCRSFFVPSPPLQKLLLTFDNFSCILLPGYWRSEGPCLRASVHPSSPGDSTYLFLYPHLTKPRRTARKWGRNLWERRERGICNSFRMNTRKTVSKTALTTFRMNTSKVYQNKGLYLPLESTLMKNRGRGGCTLLTSEPCRTTLPVAFATNLEQL